MKKEIGRLSSKSIVIDQSIAEENDLIEESRKQKTIFLNLADNLEDPAPEIEAIESQITEVEQHNESIAAREHEAKQVDRLAEFYSNSRVTWQTLNIIVEKLRELRASLLEGVNLGFPGLHVRDRELYIGNVPLSQASSAIALRVACTIAMKDKPQLALLRIDNGEKLDENSRRTLFEMADQNGFQILFTSVTNGDDISVEIVNKEQ